MPLTLAASRDTWCGGHDLIGAAAKKAEDRTCLFVLLIIIKGGACGKSVITTNSDVKNNDI